MLLEEMKSLSSIFFSHFFFISTIFLKENPGIQSIWNRGTVYFSQTGTERETEF
jgi:hypothetical protein